MTTGSPKFVNALQTVNNLSSFLCLMRLKLKVPFNTVYLFTQWREDIWLSYKKTNNNNYELWTIDYFHTIKKMLIAYSWRLDWMPPFSSYSSFPLLAPIPICKWKSKKAEPSFLCYIVCTSNHTAILHHDCHSRSS